MGSPVSPFVANIFMEDFEDTVLRTAQNPPGIWKRFVDDTSVVLYTEHKESFLQHINNIDSAIKLTVEDTILYHSWIHWSHQNTMEHSSQVYKENPPIQIPALGQPSPDRGQVQ